MGLRVKKDVLKLTYPGSFLTATHLKSLRSASDYSEVWVRAAHQKLDPDTSTTEKYNQNLP